MLIDTFSGLPDRAILGSWLRAFCPYSGYVRLFGEKIAPAMGITSAELTRRMKADGISKTVDGMLDSLSDSFMPLDTYVQVLDALGMQAQGIWFHVEDGDMWSRPALRVAAQARQKYPNRFFLLPSFNLDGETADKVKSLHEQVGLAGVTTLAFCDGCFPDDPAYYPLYKQLSKLGLVLWNHTVNSWSEGHVSEYGHPRYVDKIATLFPELKIVMGHGGWPWVLEAITVARRQPNVYLEPSSHRWKHLSRSGSGWEPLMYYGNWNAAHKILFGSMWQLQGLPLATVIDEVRGLPLREENLKKWTYENAMRLYGLSSKGI